MKTRIIAEESSKATFEQANTAHSNLLDCCSERFELMLQQSNLRTLTNLAQTSTFFYNSLKHNLTTATIKLLFKHIWYSNYEAIDEITLHNPDLLVTKIKVNTEDGQSKYVSPVMYAAKILDVYLLIRFAKIVENQLELIGKYRSELADATVFISNKKLQSQYTTLLTDKENFYKGLTSQNTLEKSFKQLGAIQLQTVPTHILLQFSFSYSPDLTTTDYDPFTRDQNLQRLHKLHSFNPNHQNLCDLFDTKSYEASEIKYAIYRGNQSKAGAHTNVMGILMHGGQFQSDAQRFSEIYNNNLSSLNHFKSGLNLGNKIKL